MRRQLLEDDFARVLRVNRSARVGACVDCLVHLQAPALLLLLAARQRHHTHSKPRDTKRAHRTTLAHVTVDKEEDAAHLHSHIDDATLPR